MGFKADLRAVLHLLASPDGTTDVHELIDQLGGQDQAPEPEPAEEAEPVAEPAEEVAEPVEPEPAAPVEETVPDA